MTDLSLGVYMAVLISQTLMVLAGIAAFNYRATITSIVLAELAVVALTILFLPPLVNLFGG